jgi:hypothetical protein
LILTKQKIKLSSILHTNYNKESILVDKPLKNYAKNDNCLNRNRKISLMVSSIAIEEKEVYFSINKSKFMRKLLKLKLDFNDGSHH